VLTGSWLCEQHIYKLVVNADSSGGGAAAPTRLPGGLPALLAVLRDIREDLVPTERVLWELLSSDSRSFGAAYSRADVTAALRELQGHSLARDGAGSSKAELEELRQLREDCLRQSMAVLFEGSGQEATAKVVLAEVLRWWWDMSEEYRVAAGLVVPAGLLQRSLQRQPEQMFRAQLQRAAADSSSACAALRIHVRALAELRALAVRRAIEAAYSRSATGSQTTTSEGSEPHSAACGASEAAEEAEGSESEGDGAAEGGTAVGPAQGACG